MSNLRVYSDRCTSFQDIELTLTKDVHKLKDVLRCNEDDSVYLFDGKGREYEYRIHTLTKNKVVLKKLCMARYQEKPQSSIMLGFPLMRENKIDFVLQKATELGVDRFVPFVSSRCVVKKAHQAKYKRWDTILIEATRQSQRLWLPSLDEVRTFKDILDFESPMKLVASLGGDSISALIRKTAGCTIFLVVGPEGDFSESEKRALKDNMFKEVGLSEHILRTETAAAFGVGLLRYHLYAS